MAKKMKSREELIEDDSIQDDAVIGRALRGSLALLIVVVQWLEVVLVLPFDKAETGGGKDGGCSTSATRV